MPKGDNLISLRMMPKHEYLNKIVDWASREEPIRAVVVTGSLARDDGSVDEWSDLDVQIIASDFAEYIRDDSWLDALGEVWIRFPLDVAAPYRLVWFAGGKKVDFQFSRVAALEDMIDRGELSEEYQRGYIAALDKDNRFQNLPPSPHIFPQAALPNPEELHAVINEFWFEALHVAQFIRRREFWVVKFRDWTMKGNLLRLLECRATRDKGVNTWLIGKRIRDWVDPETYRALEGIWSSWDAAELWESLLLQIDLFHRLSLGLTAELGYPYHAETYAKIQGYIRELYAGDSMERPNQA